MQILTPIWQQLNKTAVALKATYARFGACMTSRQEPVVVWLYGRTNIGKTQLIDHMLAEINEKTGRQLKKFTISKGPDYWNGFVGQQVIAIDDFGCWLGPEGNLDALHLFNIKTSAPHNVNMAGMEEKSYMATPFYVLIASNNPTVPLNTGVADIEAFERRRDFFIKVSWKEHEHCKPNCEHLKKIKDEQIQNAGKMSFKHLKLELCDPFVSVFREVQEKVKRSIKDDKLIYGDQITVEKLIDEAIALEKGFNSSYMMKFKSTYSRQSTVTKFLDYPLYGLVGPPGTGKSYIFQQLKAQKGASLLYITTLTEFDKFCQEEYALTQGITMVVFDDMSTFVGSPHIHKFIKDMKNRCDTTTTITPWVVGINEKVFNPVMYKALNAEGIEAEIEINDVFYRRMNKITTSFKRPFFGTRHTPDKVRKKIAAGKDINEYVEYKFNQEKVCQSTVASMLACVKVEVVEVTTMDRLELVKPVQPDCSAIIDISTEEFLEIIENTSVKDILNLLRSEKVKINYGILQPRDIFNRIMKSVQDAKSHLGCSFASLEDFFLECSNQKFFSNFEGIRCYLKFKNRAFSIEKGPQGHSVIFLLDDPTMQIVEAQMALNGLSKAITIADFTALSTTNFSPWFCFVGDLIAMLVKVSVTAISVGKSIEDTNNSHAALRVFKSIHEAAHDHTNACIEAMPGEFKRKLYIDSDRRDKSAFALVTDQDDPYASARQPETDKTYFRNLERKLKEKPVSRSDGPWREAKPETDKTERRKTKHPKSRSDVPNWRKEGVLLKEEQDITGLRTKYFEPGELEYVEERVRPTGKFALQSVVKLETLSELTQAPVLQSCSDPELIPVTNNVASNMIQIVNAAGVHICYGLVIKKSYATSVWHLLLSYPKLEGLFAIDYMENRYKMILKTEVKTTDRVDFDLEPLAGSITFKDITKFLAPANYNNYNMRDAVLVTLSRHVSLRTPVMVFRSFRVKSLTTVYCDHAGERINLIAFVGHKIGYAATGMITRAGDCGSLLIVSDGNQTGKIIGLHSRASDNEAFVRPINREDFDSIRMETAANVLGAFMHEAVPVEEEGPKIGRATYNPFLPSKTRLHVNIAPVGPKLYEPSILSKEDTRNPGHDMVLSEGLKWTTPKPELNAEDKNLYRKCMLDLAEQVVNTLSRNNAQLRVLTKREALNKYDRATHSEPIPISTSAGYPWNHMGVEGGKRGYILVDRDNGSRRFQDNDRVRKLHGAIDRYINSAHGIGVCEEPIFQVFLKDEPLSFKKIYEVPKTRTIAAAPLHFNIVHRMYIHAGVASLADSQNELFTAIGIDPTSSEWDMMFKKASTFGNKANAMDYQGWDFGLLPFEVECIAEFWNYIYRRLDTSWKPEDDKVRIKLYQDLARACILLGRDIFRANGGMMSGQPGTAPDNSVANATRKRFDWCKIMLEALPLSSGLDYYNKFVFEKYYGDDFFQVVSKFLEEIYNNLTIKAVEEKYFGAVMTHPNKESEIKPNDDFHTITFMSRNFKFIGDRCYGVLEWKRVCKPTWWVHDTRNHHFYESPNKVVLNLDHAFAAYESALMEAVTHGNVKFSEIRNRAQSEFDRRGYDKVLPDFDTMWLELQGFPPPPGMREGIEYHELPDVSRVCGLRRPAVPKHAIKFANRTAWSYGQGYTYKGGEHPTNIIPPQWQKLLNMVNEQFKRNWNSILVNHYAPGQGIPWHYDNERELDITEGVGCLTLYGDGVLHLHKDLEPGYSHLLKPGDFYILTPENLLHYRHKRDTHKSYTMSVTFRKIVPHYE